MICTVCNSKEFLGTSSVAIGHPTLCSGKEPLGRAVVGVEMTFTCQTCEHQMFGRSTATLACRLDDSSTPYPLRMYEFVRKSYGDGWNARAEGRRLNNEELDNPSMYEGWCNAQEHSQKRGGKAPPKRWGHATSKEYLKTETACQHLKMISLSELPT